jgi:hypothetical protein
MPLPQREWVAKIDPGMLEQYLSDPNPSAQLQRTHIVWSDEFDNIIEPTLLNDAPGLSRTQLCRLRNNEAVFSHRGYSHDRPSLLQGFRPSHLLFTDDCFLDGLLEGVGLILVIVFFMAAAVGSSVLIRRRISSRTTDDTRLSRSPKTVSRRVDEKTEIVEFVEAV